MSHETESHHSHESLEGRHFSLTTPSERERVVNLALDYRGDVTLQLSTGEQVAGYLFDKQSNGEGTTLKFFADGVADAMQVDYDEVVALCFSGADTAFGKSWDDWAKKMEKVSQKPRLSS